MTWEAYFFKEKSCYIILGRSRTDGIRIIKKRQKELKIIKKKCLRNYFFIVVS